MVPGTRKSAWCSGDSGCADPRAGDNPFVSALVASACRDLTGANEELTQSQGGRVLWKVWLGWGTEEGPLEGVTGAGTGADTWPFHRLRGLRFLPPNDLAEVVLCLLHELWCVCALPIERNK